MTDSEELKLRTKQFAHRCVRLSTALPNTPLADRIRNQLIGSSTSVAANYRAACIAQSKASFVAKISIVIEEVDESAFWIEFLSDAEMIEQNQLQSLLAEAQELTKIFIATRKTARGV